MARRRRSRTLDPMELEIKVPILPDTPIQYIDIAQCLSLMNRKFIRQQQSFAIRSVELVTNGSGTVIMHRLRNDWTTINALEKAYHVWRESQDQVLDGNESIKSKYHDFKVFMDTTHKQIVANDGPASNAWPIGYMKPSDATAISASAVYDWDYSELEMPNDPTSGTSTSYNFHVVGGDTSAGQPSLGIISGYAASRSRPQSNDPNTVDGDGGWMVQAFDVGENLPEIVTDVVENNDQPPYILDQDTAFEFYPGGDYNYQSVDPDSAFNFATVDVFTANGATALTRTPSSGPFVAPAGLLQIVSTITGQSGELANFLKITVEAGPSKGVLSMDIKDVN